MRSIVSVALLVMIAPAYSDGVMAQDPARPAVIAAPATAPIPAARPADVASADAIIAALYAAISGPAGQKRDWERFRPLFIPDGRLIVARPPRPEGAQPPRVMTVEQYIAGSGALENGFFEREISQVTETFGGVTHRFSTYESRRRAEDPAPFARGINSIQLLNDGKRWWIVTVFWDSERPDNPIPAKYLPPPRTNR
jgi:hypothetical protein